jgi:hypothetical protein
MDGCPTEQTTAAPTEAAFVNSQGRMPVLVSPTAEGLTRLAGSSCSDLIGVDLQHDCTWTAMRNVVIPGPSPASSAMEPGIQLHRQRQELDSGFYPRVARAAPE